ncbi:MAG: RNA polymerase sigma factor region1.1 domain-containing protein, partial [Candidatus Berkiella sp.]
MNYVDQEQQATQLQDLIAAGKEKGYLTYAEVSDLLPYHIVDPEQVEDIISMINDMGIDVYEDPPDEDALNLSDTVAEDDDMARDAAVEALSFASADSEFGRTTDPVRMYMREMGTVELLTRQGEIEIAKRIEVGLRQVLSALAAYSPNIAYILKEYDRYLADQIRLGDIISGFVQTDDDAEIIPIEIEADFESGDIDEDSDEVAVAPAGAPASAGAQANANNNNAGGEDGVDGEDSELETGPDPELAAQHFAKLREAYINVIGCEKKYGLDHPETAKHYEELANVFACFKIVPRLFESLVGFMRKMLEDIRVHEKGVMALCVYKGKMPRQAFVTSFPGNEINTNWIDSQIELNKPYSNEFKKIKEDVINHQEQL